jgi:hypothetical protein
MISVSDRHCIKPYCGNHVRLPQVVRNVCYRYFLFFTYFSRNYEVQFVSKRILSEFHTVLFTDDRSIDYNIDNNKEDLHDLLTSAVVLVRLTLTLSSFVSTALQVDLSSFKRFKSS